MMIDARGSSAAAEALAGAATSPPGGSAAAPAPREGLPPCVRVAVRDERRAFLFDAAVCGHKTASGKRFLFAADYFNGWVTNWCHHPSALMPSGRYPVISQVLTDDPDEAEAAWERAERWVRTGELDEG